jgi:putative regulator of septum formation
MTEGATPGSDEAAVQPPAAPPDQPPDAPAAYDPSTVPVPPAGYVPPVAPPPKKKSRLRPVIIIGAILVFIGVALYATRNNVEANDLKVGDCFVIPSGDTVKTVEAHPCTESHNAEVTFVGDFAGDTYPISISLDNYVSDNCVATTETYVGRSLDADPALYIGYFSPTQKSWEGGDRSITCYVALEDESMTTSSLKK